MRKIRPILLSLLAPCSLLLFATLPGCANDLEGDFTDAYFNADADAEPSGDRYDAVGTNPFVLTGHDPFSTFAADVDTASYDILRRDIVNYDTLPDPDSVRLEEYVNNFSYDYPAPAADDEVPFAISLAAAPALRESPTTLLRVGIQGKVVPGEEKRPANLVFLIDTSGSMQDSDKLPLVQNLLTATLDVLDPDDTVAIVTYAGNSGLALPPTPVSNSDVIADKIDSFSAGGSTAGGAGIELAYATAEEAYIDGGINHVILCTDGDFNVGISDTDSLVSLIEKKKQNGITFTALGFGRGNLNDAMMEEISNAGDGYYSVISTQLQAERYVAMRILSTLITIARDVKIQVELNPEKVYAYRLLGYENRQIADEDFRADAVDGGEIGSGHRVTALYELVLAGDEVPVVDGAPDPLDGEAVEGEREIDPADLVLVKVRYKEAEALPDSAAFEVSKSLPATSKCHRLDEADADMRYAVAIAAFAEILKESPYADPGALSLIENIAMTQAARDADRAEFAEIFTRARELLGQ